MQAVSCVKTKYNLIFILKMNLTKLFIYLYYEVVAIVVYGDDVGDDDCLDDDDDDNDGDNDNDDE